MNVSLNWLKEFVSLGERPEKLAELMTQHAQEVESIDALVEADGLFIGKIKALSPHPDAKKLTVCDVDIGKETLRIVCGAANAKAGQTVIVAREGATLAGGLKLEKTDIRGIVSEGMICSLSELGIDEKYHHEDGIHVIEESLELGKDALKALHLNDTVMKLDLTPNRADLLSMHGVAYEMSALLDVPLSLKEPDIKISPAARPLNMTTTTSSCRSYYGLIIENLTVKKSPQWMRARLIAAGIRPINIIVDITNYVMLETGQPLHAFDADRLQHEAIVVREALEAERFVTLDDKERVLEQGDILITDGNRAIALGGVMGGADTEVGHTTSRILLESAVFDPIAIRKTSHRLGLRSESSLRFERGVDPEKTQYALFRAAELFVKHAGGKVKDGVSGFDNHSTLPRTVVFAPDTVNRVLGSDYSEAHIEGILKRLRFEYTVEDGRFTVVCPSRRADLQGVQDIIEEIARLSGFNDLPDTLPKTVSTGVLTPIQRRRRKTRAVLAGLGFDEVVGYALTDIETVRHLTRDRQAAIVELANPMSESRAVMRLGAVKTLLEIIRYNAARQAERVAIYELGKTYQKSGEKEVLSLAFYGDYHRTRWHARQATDFYTLKAVFDALCAALRVDGIRYEATTIEGYHPHQCALIKHKETTLGHIGKIHPRVAARYDVDDVYVLEADFMVLHAIALQDVSFSPPSRYPSVSRDLAVVLDKNISAAAVLETVEAALKDTVFDIDIFDVYTGKRLDANKKSLGVRLSFSSAEKTLTTEAVDRLLKRVIDALKDTVDAHLR